jgi:hypothetical protein
MQVRPAMPARNEASSSWYASGIGRRAGSTPALSPCESIVPSSVAPSKEIVIVAHRTSPSGAVDPVTLVRSTLLASSVLGVRERGLMEEYEKLLPPEMHGPVLNAVTGSWLPVEVAMAHYRAVEALQRPVAEQYAAGEKVAARIQDSVLRTLVRVARSAGVTPWTGLEYFPRLWDRLLMGGSPAVYKLGPKEARVEIHGVPMIEFACFRNGWRGMFGGSGRLFANQVFVHEIARYTTATDTAFRISWA